MFGWRLVRVEGDSMKPVLDPGTYGVFRHRQIYRDGDIVLIDHPTYGAIIKRIRNQTPQGFWLVGENDASLTTSQLGLVPQSCILGRLAFTV